MIIIKHTKSNNLAFVSHVDYMRVLQRALLRAGIKVKMSEGFNPHPITFCSHPLPVGVESNAEYFCYVESDDKTTAEVAELFDKSTPDGIKIVEVIKTEVNPKIVMRVNCCEYITPVNLTHDEVVRVTEFLGMTPNPQVLIRKGEAVDIDLAPMILAHSIGSGILTLRLVTGNPTLRPDRLIEYINANCKLTTNINITDTVRVGHYMDEDGVLVNIDDYIKRLSI